MSMISALIFPTSKYTSEENGTQEETMRLTLRTDRGDVVGPDGSRVTCRNDIGRLHKVGVQFSHNIEI